MLENLLTGVSTVPPSGDVIFQLKDFKTVDDIVDRGPLSIPVTRGGAVSVGSDANGSFIQMPGASWADIVTFGSAKLSCNEVEVNIIIGDMEDTSGAYGPCIFDARPQGQNGNYLLFTIVGSPDAIEGHYREFVINSGQNGFYPGAKLPKNTIGKLRVKCLKNKTFIYYNERFVASYNAGISNFIGDYAGIGRHAFSMVTGTTPLKAKIYYFDIRKIS